MITDLAEKLVKYGNIQVLKDEYVFTLLLTKRTKKLSFASTVFEVMEIVTDYLGESKPIIEVMKNDEEFLLLILRPKI